MLPVTEAIVTELSKRYDSSGDDVEKGDLSLKTKKQKKRSPLSEASSEPLKPKDKGCAYHQSGAVATVRLSGNGNASQFKSDQKHTSRHSSTSSLAPEARTLRIAFFLSVAYSANIGGTGTITGTGPNLVLQGLMDE
jgi:di/tricarboxylate transporter